MTTWEQMTERYSIFYKIIEAEHPVSIQGIYYRLLSVEATQPNVLSTKGLRAVKGTGLANLVSRTVTAMRRGDFKTRWDRQSKRSDQQYKIPHHWIVEAGRRELVPNTWESIGDLISAYAPGFRRSLWVESDVYVEVWPEAATMVGVLEPVTDELDVYLRPTGGSYSETLVWRASQRINAVGRETFIYQVGDFDYKGQRGLVAVALALAAPIPVAHADDPPGDPVQCKDSQGTFGNSHICRYSDGSVWNCISSFLPVVGPPCSRVNVALRPDFWTTP